MKPNSVASFEDVLETIRNYNQELPDSGALQKIISMHRGWYAVREKSGQWRFAPSKCVGYKNNTAEHYLQFYNTRDGMDGRESEPTLKRWFAEIESGHPLYSQLQSAFAKFAAGFGKSPNKTWRVSVSRSHLADSADVTPSPSWGSAMSLHERISADPAICGGRPCIRGTRMRVNDIVDMIAEGASQDEILEDFPYLEKEDLAAALKYAARSLDHTMVRAA